MKKPLSFILSAVLIWTSGIDRVCAEAFRPNPGAGRNFGNFSFSAGFSFTPFHLYQSFLALSPKDRVLFLPQALTLIRNNPQAFEHSSWQEERFAPLRDFLDKMSQRPSGQKFEDDGRDSEELLNLLQNTGSIQPSGSWVTPLQTRSGEAAAPGKGGVSSGSPGDSAYAMGVDYAQLRDKMREAAQQVSAQSRAESGIPAPAPESALRDATGKTEDTGFSSEVRKAVFGLMDRAARLAGRLSRPIKSAALVLALSVPLSARPLYVMDEKLSDRTESWLKAEKFSKDISPKYRRDRIAEVSHVRLEIAPDLEQKRISGNVTHAFKILATQAEQIELDSVGLKIEEVQDGQGKKMDYEVLPEKIVVHLGRKYKAGESLRVRIKYSGSPKTGLQFFKADPNYPSQPLLVWSQGQPEDNRSWVPSYDYPNNRAPTEMLVTVPEGFTAVSNGKLVEKTPGSKPGTTIFHWLQQRPHVSYLMTLVVGKLAEIKDDSGPVPLYYYFRPGKEKEAELGFHKTPDMIRFFSEILQEPFPWDKYAQIALYGFPGGMENTSATSLTEKVLLDARARPDVDMEPLLAHELVHQWFGDLLTCKDWSHIWLNEGFASYFAMLYMEHLLGKDRFAWALYSNAQGYFGEAGSYQRPIVTEKYARPLDMFDAHTYPKGAWVLHMLRKELGEEAFWKGLRKYVRDFKDKTVETEDLRRTFEEVTGKSLLRFFNQWVYGPGHPALKVKLEWDAPSKTVRLKVKQTQADDKHPSFSFKLPVEFQVKSSRKSFEAALDGPEASFEWKLDRRPKMIRIDPDHKVLMSLDLEIPQDMLIYQLKNDADVYGRIVAIKTLSKMGTPEVVEALGEVLKKDSFWGIQQSAAGALGGIGGPRVLEILISNMNSSNARVRQAVAGALGEFYKNEAAFQALKTMIEKDLSYLVQQSALSSLGRLGLEGASDILKAKLSEDSWDESIRKGALSGLGALQKEKDITLLEEWSKPGKPVAVRSAAFSALAQTARKKDSTRDDARDFLSQILDQEEDSVIRGAAIGALEALGDPKAISALSKIIARDWRVGIREQAQRAIESIQEGKKGKYEALSGELDQLRQEQGKLIKRVEELEKKK